MKTSLCWEIEIDAVNDKFYVVFWLEKAHVIKYSLHMTAHGEEACIVIWQVLFDWMVSWGPFWSWEFSSVTLQSVQQGFVSSTYESCHLVMNQFNEPVDLICLA